MMGISKNQGPQERLSVHFLISMNCLMHCMFVLQLEHLLLIIRTSSSTRCTFDLNKYSHSDDLYALNDHSICTMKFTLPENSKVGDHFKTAENSHIS